MSGLAGLVVVRQFWVAAGWWRRLTACRPEHLPILLGTVTLALGKSDAWTAETDTTVSGGIRC